MIGLKPSLLTNWDAPPENLNLRQNDVHVWRVDFEQQLKNIVQFKSFLSGDELNRAERFHFEKDHNAFTITRGLLRYIISHYLAVTPQSLRFSYNNYGKPALTDVVQEKMLSFNVSHSGNLALIALAPGGELGVDVEKIRLDFADLQIAKRFFSSREVATLSALPKYLQKECFFYCWTRKEAFIKAQGKGLALPLNRFSVSLTPDVPVKLIEVQWNSAEVSRWSFFDLKPHPDYKAALAISGAGWKVRCWKFQEIW